MNRANSIKKAVRRVLEMTEEVLKKSRPCTSSKTPEPVPPRISPRMGHQTVPPGQFIKIHILISFFKSEIFLQTKIVSISIFRTKTNLGFSFHKSWRATI